MVYSDSTKKIDYLGVTGINFVTTEKQKFLGFNTAGTWSPIDGVLTSNDVVDWSGTNSINILTDINIETFNNMNKNSNLLLSVYPDTDSQGFINYRSESFRSIKLNNDRLALQRFQLVD